MRTNLRAQHRRARKGKVQKITIAVVFIVLVFLLNYFGFQPIQPIAHAIASPFWKIQTGAYERISSYAELLKSKKSLVEENRELSTLIEERSVVGLQSKALEKENAELKHLLGREKTASTTLGAVLSRPNVSVYDTVIIDMGSEDGIHVGNTVLALGDFAVGFVSSVERKTAEVTLHSSPGVKTNVFIGNENIEAVAQGVGGGNFRVQLSRDAEIQEGDVIILSNFDTQIFGEVETILKTETDAFQTVLFKSPVNIFTLRWVEVVIE